MHALSPKRSDFKGFSVRTFLTNFLWNCQLYRRHKETWHAVPKQRNMISSSSHKSSMREVSYSFFVIWRQEVFPQYVYPPPPPTGLIVPFHRMFYLPFLRLIHIKMMPEDISTSNFNSHTAPGFVPVQA